MKIEEKNKAIRLRKGGKSYGEILKQLSVSKSTLSLWLRDIELTEKQKSLLLKGRQKSRYAGAKAKQRQRIERTKQIIEESKREVKRFWNDPLFLAGLMLYWAEGDKSDNTENVKFSNSDPSLIQLIMRWFREICKVPEKKFRITIHIHELHCRSRTERYWSKITNIPLSQFYKTQIKQTSLRQRRNILYDGTCAVSVSNRDLFRRIKGWKLGIVNKFRIFVNHAPVVQRIERRSSKP